MGRDGEADAPRPADEEPPLAWSLISGREALERWMKLHAGPTNGRSHRGVRCSRRSCSEPPRTALDRANVQVAAARKTHDSPTRAPMRGCPAAACRLDLASGGSTEQTSVPHTEPCRLRLPCALHTPDPFPRARTRHGIAGPTSLSRGGPASGHAHARPRRSSRVALPSHGEGCERALAGGRRRWGARPGGWWTGSAGGSAGAAGRT